MSFKTIYENIISEAQSGKPVIGYVGRFQPFHINHYKTYQHLVKKYGKDNVYILTSDKTDKKKSPFNFKDKLKVMNMFGIPKDKIVMEKIPYIPLGFLESKKISGDRPFIAAVGDKDRDRLKHFVDYKGASKDNKDLLGWQEDSHERAKITAYYDVTPLMLAKFEGEMISGTTVRDVFNGDDEEKQKELFKVLYTKYDEKMFNFIKDKINGK